MGIVAEIHKLWRALHRLRQWGHTPEATRRDFLYIATATVGADVGEIEGFLIGSVSQKLYSLSALGCGWTRHSRSTSYASDLHQ